MVRIKWLIIFIIVGLLFVMSGDSSVNAASSDKTKQITLPSAKPGSAYVEQIRRPNLSNKAKFFCDNLPSWLSIDQEKGYLYGKMPKDQSQPVNITVKVKDGFTNYNYQVLIDIFPKLETLLENGKISGYMLNGEKISHQEFKDMEKVVKDFLNKTAKPHGISPKMVKIPDQMTTLEKAQYLSNLQNILKIKADWDSSDKGDKAKSQLIQSLQEHQSNSNILYLTFKVKELENSRK